MDRRPFSQILHDWFAAHGYDVKPYVIKPFDSWHDDVVVNDIKINVYSTHNEWVVRVGGISRAIGQGSVKDKWDNNISYIDGKWSSGNVGWNADSEATNEDVSAITSQYPAMIQKFEKTFKMALEVANNVDTTKLNSGILKILKINHDDGFHLNEKTLSKLLMRAYHLGVTIKTV